MNEATGALLLLLTVEKSTRPRLSVALWASSFAGTFLAEAAWEAATLWREAGLE